MAREMEPITLIALFTKAQTLVDGGWRVSFDFDQQQAKELMELSRYRGDNIALKMVIVPISDQSINEFRRDYS